MKEYTGLTNKEALDLLRHRRIVIYGAGYVAEYFWSALEDLGLTDRVCDVIVTTLSAPRQFHGIDVKELSHVKLPKDCLVCLAVHDVSYRELRNQISGLADFLWVKPYCQGNNFHDPLKNEIWLPTKDVVQRNLENRYNIAIRCLVAAQMEGKNEVGKEIYKKHIEKYASHVTAEKRLERFCSMIRRWQEQGYKDGHPIWIDEEGHILDGEHRAALCFYFHQPNICVNVYSSSSFYPKFVKRLATNQRVLTSGIFAKSEIKTILEMQKDILRRCSGSSTSW